MSAGAGTAGQEQSSSFDPGATLAFTTPARDTNPPPTNIYAPGGASTAPGTPPPAPLWSPTPPPPAHTSARKSSTTPWIIGAVATVIVLGIGIVVLLTIIGSRTQERNKNSGPGVVIPNSTPSSVMRDDFSEQHWPAGESAYGSYYKDGQYHMKAQPDLYVYMFPRNTGNYASKNATVKVTARSVSGTSPEYGYGLIVHGKVNSKGTLDGYGFLIYTGSTPGYKITQFKDGTPNDLVDWTESSVIRASTSPNQLEVRASGSQLSFYVNGQFLKSVTDTSNMTEGFVGLYTSETPEIAFDDLEIDRSAKAATP